MSFLSVPARRQYVCHHKLLLLMTAVILVTSFAPSTNRIIQQAVIEHGDLGDVKGDRAFLSKVVQVARNINADPVELLTLMSFESSGTFSPSIRGPYVPGRGRAVGLIQFMPDVAVELGTSAEALERMSRTEQMDFVEKYFKKRGFVGGGIQQLYSTVFAGNPNASLGISDGYHTLGSAIRRMKIEHEPRAKALLGVQK